jgi:two-component system sensor histidine kinase VicK
MRQSYRNRMVFYSFFAYFAVFAIILIVLIQGALLIGLSRRMTRAKQIHRDTILFIRQEKGYGRLNDQNLRAAYQKNASAWAKALSDLESNNTDIFLWNRNRELLGTSSQHNQTFNTSMQPISAKLKTVRQRSFYYHSRGDKPYLLYIAPLKVDGRFLGYLGIYFSLNALHAMLMHVLRLYLLAASLGLLILLAIFFRLFNYLMAPITDLTQIAHKMTKGDYNVQISYGRKDEIGQLSQVFNQMAANTAHVIRQLDMERQRLASVLAAFDDGVLALDRNGTIITSNAYIRKYFNVANPKTIYDFQFQSFLRDIFDQLRNGKDHISEEIDCDDRSLLIIGSPIGGAGVEENYLLIIRNVTATKQFHEDQRKFISSVSHELRTPLTTIIGYTDMLTRRHIAGGPILENSLNTINHEGNRLLRLVDDLLNANRLDLREFDVRRTNLNLHHLLSDVIAQMQIKAEPRGIAITYKSDDPLPEILGDYDRLAQLFINILHNAIKYSNDGDIIDVVSTVDADYLVTSIRDYGIGMSDNELQKIFDAFYRVDEDRSRSSGEGGAGLGLYLVKQIAEKHHGRIQIESKPGEGTNVMVLLPYIGAYQQEETHHASQ